MTLNPDDLKDDLKDLVTSPPPSAAAAAQAWATAVRSYAGGVLPVAAAPAVAAAAGVLQTALVAAFATPSAAAAMEAEFMAFGASVGLAMAPAFVATPPAGPVGFVTLFATKRSSANAGAAAVSGAIDAWMKTATAVPSVGGAAVPWA
jgi:hypothetical protein